MAQASKRKAQFQSGQQSVKGDHPASSTHCETGVNLIASSSQLHQVLLNVYSLAFPALLDPNTVNDKLQPLLQRIKHFLYERDFSSAFSEPDLLSAYAVRWSPGRTLAFLEILSHSLSQLQYPGETPVSQRHVRVSCLGGGAGAELVALAGVIALQSINEEHLPNPIRDIHMDAIDIADWSPILKTLYDTIVGSADLYSPTTALPLHFTSTKSDLLDRDGLRDGGIVTSSLAAADIVTIFFTLNELYSTSMPRTQAMLLDLTRLIRPGGLLVVVDSPGSYSTVTLGNSTKQSGERKYPMSWLLDHALLKLATGIDSDKDERSKSNPWEKLDNVESRWFRIPEALRYPIPLEDMRYQLHLFRRLAPG